MEPALIKPENDRNPLKVVLYVFLILAAIYAVMFTNIILNKGFDELIAKKGRAIIGFLLIAVFVITYYRKSIFAWWIPFVSVFIDWPVSLLSFMVLLICRKHHCFLTLVCLFVLLFTLQKSTSRTRILSKKILVRFLQFF